MTPPPKQIVEVRDTKLNKYDTTIKGKGKDKGKYMLIDIYSVLEAYSTDSALDHAIKKLLMAGKRGVKSSKQDKEEAIKSIQRSIELGE